MSKFPAIALILSQSICVAAAADLSYTYADVGAIRQDINGDNATGGAVAISAAVHKNVAIIGGYSSVTSDDLVGANEFDVRNASLGLAFHARVSETTDVVASVKHLELERETGGTTVDTEGQDWALGIRVVASPALEVFGNFLHIRGQGESESGINLGLRTGLVGPLSGGLSYSSIKNLDTASVFLRLNW
jgi:hypothetical protein